MAKVLMMVNDEEKQVRISKMKVKQLKKALKKIQEIVKFLKESDSTSDLMDYFLGAEAPDLENEDPEAVLKEDKEFLEKILGAMTVLFNQIPDEITELIAVISGIDEEVIDEQEMDTLFDIVEAIVTENDLKALISRAKSTFFTVRNKWGGGVLPQA